MTDKTPTPLSYERSTRTAGRTIVKAFRGGKGLLFCIDGPGSEQMAAEIVRAVNAHDDLVKLANDGEKIVAAALGLISKFCEEADDWQGAATKLNDDILAWRNAYTAALTKAEARS